MGVQGLEIKVCGMKHQDNIDDLLGLDIDFVGNIFFLKSPRNLDRKLNTNCKKVGVFVKESTEVIKAKIKEHQLEIIQLHGGESNDFCLSIKEFGVEVLKVFSVGDDFEYAQLHKFPNADLFLFDTKTKNHGGAGRKFDWSLLNRIDKESPKKYFLAGGIDVNDAKEIKRLNLINLIGLDLNSKFEIEPGLKDVELLKEFLEELRK